MLSSATRAQLQRVNDPHGILPCLILSHPSMTTLYLVSDTRDWNIGGTIFLGLPFRFKLPQDTQGQAPRAVLEVDNVGREIVDALEQLPLGAALTATLRLVSRATPTVVDYEFVAPLAGVSATPAVLTATVGNDDALRAPAVRVRYDPTLRPGLFAG